jgi:hypothetical protein
VENDWIVRTLTWQDQVMTRGRVRMTGGSGVAGSGHDVWHMVLTVQAIWQGDCAGDRVVQASPCVTRGPITGCHATPLMRPIRPGQKFCCTSDGFKHMTSGLANGLTTMR